MAPKKAAAKKEPLAPVEDVRAVTQEDLDAHPEWENVNVGDMVDFSQVEEDEAKPEPTAEVTPAKGAKGALAIVTEGGEFIRIYEDKDAAAEFIGKKADRKAIPASSVKKLTVTFGVLDPKTGVISNHQKHFSPADGSGWVESAIVVRNETRGTLTYTV